MIWKNPASDIELFPELTAEDIEAALKDMDWEEIRRERENDPEWQKRIRKFRPKLPSIELLLKPIR